MFILTRTKCHADQNRSNPCRVAFALVEVVQELEVEHAKRVGDAIRCKGKEDSGFWLERVGLNLIIMTT